MSWSIKQPISLLPAISHKLAYLSHASPPLSGQPISLRPAHLSLASPPLSGQPISLRPAHLSQASPSLSGQPISLRPAHLSLASPSLTGQPISLMPAHLSLSSLRRLISLHVHKSCRAWYFFSREQRGQQATYYMYLAIGGWLSYALSVERYWCTSSLVETLPRT